MRIVANPTSPHDDIHRNCRCPKQNKARQVPNDGREPDFRSQGGIRTAVRSLLDASDQRIEGAMQFETEFYTTGDRPTVVVIESEQVVRSALHYILRGRYWTRAFATLDDAVGSSAETPDVVLLGIAFLQSQGNTVLANLGEQFPDAKILLVAERTSDPLARASLETGAHGIVSKPISFDTVCGAVDAVLAAPILPGEPSRLIRVAFG
jgi:CheY-like chemotaxis protein